MATFLYKGCLPSKSISSHELVYCSHPFSVLIELVGKADDINLTLNSFTLAFAT